MIALLPLIAAGVKAYGQKQQGQAIKDQLDHKADQERQNAGQEIAASQRAALIQQRKGEYALSSLIARAAADGGGASDPTVLNLASRISGESAYKQALAIYQGDESARGLNQQAMEDNYSGKVQKNSYNQRAAMTLIGGAADSYSMYKEQAAMTLMGASADSSSMFNKYGGGANKKTDMGAGNGYITS
jgi:hypothetical protein